MQERKPVTKPLIALCLLSSRCPERVTVWRGGWCRTEREGAVGRGLLCGRVSLCTGESSCPLSLLWGLGFDPKRKSF